MVDGGDGVGGDCADRRPYSLREDEALNESGRCVCLKGWPPPLENLVITGPSVNTSCAK